MTIWFTRTGKITPGKLENAIRWGVKVAEHINHTISDVKVEVLNNVAGSYNELHWIMRGESLAQFEKIMSTLEHNQKYGALVREATEDGLFVKIVDNLYRVIA